MFEIKTTPNFPFHHFEYFYLSEYWFIFRRTSLLHREESLGPASTGPAHLANLEQVLEQDDDVDKVQLPALRLEGVLDEGREADGVRELRGTVTFDVLVDKKVECE